jgi:hypothetical protein
VRLARASAVAATTVALALVAHVLGGGAIPSPLVVGSLVAVVLAAAVPVGGRRLGPVGATALLGLGQLGLHGCLDALAGMGCVPGPKMAGHLHATQLACATAPAHLGPHATGAGGSAMLALHVVATLAAALLIAGTDRALVHVASWLGPLVALLVSVALPASAALPVRAENRRAPGRRAVGVVALRGPPRTPAHVALAA